MIFRREGVIGIMFLKKIKSDSGLMGPTHALSAIAIAFLVTWLASDFMFGTVLGSDSAIVFITATIIIVGAALMPDLDAVQSTSINTLGIVGTMLSKSMRAFSSIIQSTFRSSSDSPSPDPHRGFWHTFISAFIAGLITMGLTSIDYVIFSISSIDITVAVFIVVFIVYISIQLFMASLFKSFYKKSKGNPISNIVVKVISLALAIMLITFLPKDLSYNWVGAAVTFGWIAHLFGDMMTVAGVPVLWPLKFKGKRWWNFSFPLGIRAGGWIEMSILMPLFGIIIIVSAIAIIPLLK